MLDRAKLQVADMRISPLASTVTAADLTGEGMGFVGVIESGVMKARPGRANADDNVLGFSIHQERIFPTTRTIVERITVSGAGAGTLSRAAKTAAGILAKRVDTGEVLAENGAVGDGQFNATDGSAALTFHSGEFNAVVEVTYRADLTAAEALALNGDSNPGQGAAITLGSISLMTKGTLFTDMFDTNIDWAAIDTTVAGEKLKLTTGGYVSAGAGVTGSIINGYIVAVPTVDSPYLGIYINL